MCVVDIFFTFQQYLVEEILVAILHYSFGSRLFPIIYRFDFPIFLLVYLSTDFGSNKHRMLMVELIPVIVKF